MEEKTMIEGLDFDSRHIGETDEGDCRTSRRVLARAIADVFRSWPFTKEEVQWMLRWADDPRTKLGYAEWKMLTTQLKADLKRMEADELRRGFDGVEVLGEDWPG